MSEPSLTLYVDANLVSPYAMSAFVALGEKGLAFEMRTVDLDAKANTQGGYPALSLTSRVPTLTHRDFSVSESSAIAEYLEEVFPGPTHKAAYPANPRDRARARQVQAWLRSDFMPIREERPTTVIFFAPVPHALSAAAKLSAGQLFQAADSLLAPGAKNLFGEWCIADTDLALMLNRLVANGDAVPVKLAAYVKHQWQRPAVQAWMNQVRGDR